MISILLCSVIVSLFCNGLQIATGENMLLNFIKRWLDDLFLLPAIPIVTSAECETYLDAEQQAKHEAEMKALAKHLAKPRYSKIYHPILYCIKCMPSIYGTAIAFIFFPVTLHLLYQIPLVIFCSVTLNVIFYNLYAD